jgi:hypothetical protein
MSYFPRTTLPYQRRLSERDWDEAGPTAFRKLAFSILDMALVTGVMLRLGRAVLLASAGSTSGTVFATGFAVGSLFLFGMTAIHLGNFPLRHWVWRAPVFALLVGVVESGTSLILIALGREPYGSARATYLDWLPMALNTLTWRMVATVPFAIALAAVVQWTRTATLRREQRL